MKQNGIKRGKRLNPDSIILGKDHCVHVMNLERSTYEAHTHPMISHINVGTGVDCTIKELTETVANVVGYDGQLVFDASKPDGTPRKLLDVTLLSKLGWEASIPLKEGLQNSHQWYLENIELVRG